MSDWFLDVNHSGCTVDLDGIEYTGGTFTNAGTAGGLVVLDDGLTSTEMVSLKNIKGYDTVARDRDWETVHPE